MRMALALLANAWRRRWRAGTSVAAAYFLVLALASPSHAGPMQVGKEVDVLCMGTKIGTFEIERYNRLVNADKNQITIDGGFSQTIDASSLQAGASFNWVQSVKGFPVLYDWQKPDQTYIDRARKKDDTKIVADGSPFYPSGGGGVAFTISFSDTPNRNANNLPLDLFFETALVCVVDKMIMAVDSFTWGFEVSADGKTFKLKQLTETGKVSDDLLKAFRNDPDPIFQKWEIDRGCCIIPEPSSWALSLIGILMILGARSVKVSSGCCLTGWLSGWGRR
jgi:hypothetical protein